MKTPDNRALWELVDELRKDAAIERAHADNKDWSDWVREKYAGRANGYYDAATRLSAILERTVVVGDVSGELLDAWRSIAKVSGSALLSGKKKAQTEEQRGLVYREACSALICVGNAYHDLTGKHPEHAPDPVALESMVRGKS